MEKKIEILAPAGSIESLVAAVLAGADAVYVGGTRFGARAFADNFKEEALLWAIDYVHLHGRKIYLTVNTLLKETELETELYSYLLPFYKQGLDAVIVQDMGVLKFVKEHFPDLPIHASTQMTITDVTGARFLEKQGVSRVVTAREMQLDEIRKIAEYTNLEIESFVHGALCYCYSGQCLYSSLIGGRSGNRGQCAQPCRLPYRAQGEKKAQYLLSLKDICTLELIPELVEAGIHSFKIEGRMKKPEYVALVTAMYRKYTDLYLEKGTSGFFVDPEEKEKLMDLYNRGGSHEGYYHTQNGRDMISLERPNHAGVPVLKVMNVSGKSVTARAVVDIHAGDIIELPDGKENYTFANTVRKGEKTTFLTHKKQLLEKGMILNRIRNDSLIHEIEETILKQKRKEKIKGKLTLFEGISAKLVLSRGDTMVEVFGEQVQSALNQPMDKERIEKQMRKTGNTEFEFSEFEVEMEGALFLPMQALNDLRRKGIEALEQAILRPFRRAERLSRASETHVPSEGLDKHVPFQGIFVSVEEPEQLEAAYSHPAVRRIYLDANAISRIWEPASAKLIQEFVGTAHGQGKEIYLALPHIFRSRTRKQYEDAYEQIFGQGFDGILVRNYESYAFLREHHYAGNIVTDYNLYQFNRYAKQFWQEENVESMTAPLELNRVELKEVGLENSELVAYGYLPMMVSAQCVIKTVKGCKKQKGRFTFTDRYQKTFTVKNNCDYCYNMIYNTAPVMLTDQKEEIQELSPKAIRLHFTIESKSETERILCLYEDIFCKNEPATEPEQEFTRGHFKRGIK